MASGARWPVRREHTVLGATVILRAFALIVQCFCAFAMHAKIYQHAPPLVFAAYVALLLYVGHRNSINGAHFVFDALGILATAGTLRTTWNSAGLMSHAGDMEVDGDFNHDGTNMGFYGATPVAQLTGWTAFSNLITDRTCDADTVTVAELADIVGTLIEDIKTTGLLAA